MGPLGESGLADLIGLLRGRWPGRPVYLCGGSMGGSSALVFAVRRPELIDGVAAFCPASDIEAYYAYAGGSPDPTLRNIAAAIRLHYGAGGGRLEDQLRPRSALRHADRLTMPVYLSHGTADALIPCAATKGLAERLEQLGRRVTYVEIEGGDHDSPILAVNWPDALGSIETRDGG
jgi:pimeloyl-ACP methyl ester carboxylesterase